MKKTCFILILMIFLLSACDKTNDLIEIDIANENLTLEVGDTYDLDYTILFNESVVDLSSSITIEDQTVVQLDGKIITALAVGNTTIVIALVDYPDISVSINVVVIEGEQVVSSMTLEKNTNEIYKGDKFALIAIIEKITEEEVEVLWSTSDASIASVDNAGNVIANKAGNVTIEATVEGVVATISITINENLLELFDSFHEETPIRQNVQTFSDDPLNNKWQWVNGSVTRYFFSEMNLIERIIPVNENIYTGETATPENIPLAEALLKVRSGIIKPETKYIVYHDTGNSNAGADAAMHAAYMVGDYNATNRARSWHYTVDENSIYHHIPDNEVTWQGDHYDAYAKSIGIETCVDYGSDLYTTWHRTAKLMAKLLVENDLDLTAIRQHYDFNGKNCPQALRMSNLYSKAVSLIEAEYRVLTELDGAVITFESLSPEFVDDRGRVIKAPATATRVAYAVKISKNGESQEKVYYSTLKGVDNTQVVDSFATQRDYNNVYQFDLGVAALEVNSTLDNLAILNSLEEKYLTLTNEEKSILITKDYFDTKRAKIVALMFDESVDSLPSVLTLSDQGELINLRNMYEALNELEKSNVLKYDLLVDKELEMEGIINPDLGKINRAIQATPKQIIFDFDLPIDEGVTWEYQIGEDDTYFDLQSGTYLKLSHEYRPITLKVSSNDNYKEIVINFGVASSAESIVYATGAVAPVAGGLTSEGNGTYAEQAATSGFGSFAIVVNNKLYFTGKDSYIPLEKPAVGNTLTINELRPLGGTTYINNLGLVNGVPTQYRGTGALYRNVSDEALTFDPSFTYGRNNAASSGYGKVIFTPNVDGTYRVEKALPDSGTNDTTLGNTITLMPGAFLWCPHTFETNATGGTQLIQTSASTSAGVLREGIDIKIIEFKNAFN